jgi:glycosyltransferase involved in cell wall biosynthesis
MTSIPLVTVGIPTYNRPAGLQRTLECIREQTHHNLEIIISDNCSETTETQLLAEAHARADSRVRYYRQERNLGLEANFKFVLERARGEYFFWAADDDEWTLDFVSTCVEHIGSAGSVMTGMRNAIRPRGLLRWKPPLVLSPHVNAFENAVTFFSNLQPSLFYGIHRTKDVRQFLQERMYDYYDCFFILRQILNAGFQTVAPVCFHIGIDTEAPVFKPARPRCNAIYEYWPFLRDSLRETLGAQRLSPSQKVRLSFLLTYVAVNEFSHFEQRPRPVRAQLAAAVKKLLRLVRPLFAVPLPPLPSTMVLPSDLADVCTMFVPIARLEDPEALAAEVADAQRQLRAKIEVIRDLEGALRLPPETEEPEQQRALGPTDALHLEPRDRLGLLLLQLETKEARIRELVQHRERRDTLTFRRRTQL